MLLPLYANASEQQDNAFEISNNNQFYASEHPDWGRPTIQSDDWWHFDRQVRDYEYKGIYWISFDVYLKEQPVPAFDYEYNLHMLAAQEVYWDEVYLGNNGVPAASKEQEVQGNIWTTYLVPNHLLTPGKHIIKIKASSHYRYIGQKLLKEGWIAPFNPRFRYLSLGSLFPSLFVSIAFVVGLYFLMLFFTDGRQLEHLVFFLLLQCLTVHGFAIQWPHLVGYTYGWEFLNVALETIFGTLMFILMPTYFLVKHKAARIWAWLLAAILVIILGYVILEIGEVFIIAFVSFSTALIASVYYGIKHKRHLWWESLALFLCLFGVITQDLEDVYFYFPGLISLVLLTHAIAMQQRKAALQQASYIESQLRGELLRKHIQPHFLLNTLTSLMEWVETDVERSSEFIAELADEFRLMSTVSSQPLVKLEIELQLCQKHLAIMSLRLQKECSIQSDNIDGSELFPPAVFHTLLENAFSHNAYEDNELHFHIEKEVLEAEKVCFRLSAPRAMQQTSSFRKMGTGTGKKYIDARLNQSFGKHWSFREISNEKEWITEIKVDYQHLQQSPDMLEST